MADISNGNEKTSTILSNLPVFPSDPKKVENWCTTFIAVCSQSTIKTANKKDASSCMDLITGEHRLQKAVFEASPHLSPADRHTRAWTLATAEPADSIDSDEHMAWKKKMFPQADAPQAANSAPPQNAQPIPAPELGEMSGPAITARARAPS